MDYAELDIRTKVHLTVLKSTSKILENLLMCIQCKGKKPVECPVKFVDFDNTDNLNKPKEKIVSSATTNHDDFCYQKLPVQEATRLKKCKNDLSSGLKMKFNVNMPLSRAIKRASGDTKTAAAFLCKNIGIREFVVDVDEIVKLVDRTGLDNTNARNIDELLQITTGEILSHDDLNESVKQRMHKDDKVNVSEDKEQNELSTDN
ncbi:hypothetical protein M0802_013183 [Mischocyttarus mexicanus]|nr:hypothetical protein M0802_013183 [Mischocyttarus mexicanus]